MKPKDLNIYVYDTVVVTDGYSDTIIIHTKTYNIFKYKSDFSLLENSGFVLYNNSPPRKDTLIYSLSLNLIFSNLSRIGVQI